MRVLSASYDDRSVAAVMTAPVIAKTGGRGPAGRVEGSERMAEEPAAIVTDADVRSLAAKLTGLHALLTPAEQVLLHELLRRAAARDLSVSDTTGFAWAVSFNPFPYLDAIRSDGAAQTTGHNH
jgi:hypothetical protein